MTGPSPRTSDPVAPDPHRNLDDLLNEHFAGKVVRKDLTKLVKEGANVPVYVLEYLLGNYCASDDDEVIGVPRIALSVQADQLLDDLLRRRLRRGDE